MITRELYKIVLFPGCPDPARGRMLHWRAGAHVLRDAELRCRADGE